MDLAARTLGHRGSGCKHHRELTFPVPGKATQGNGVTVPNLRPDQQFRDRFVDFRLPYQHLLRPMDLQLALLCDDVRERPDGRLDIIGVIDELTAPGFPAMQQRMTVLFVMAWNEGERGPQEFRADLVAENGRRILTIEGGTDVSASGERPRTRLVLPLERVIFPDEGEYRFDLVAGGDVHPGCTLRVRAASSAGHSA